MPLTACDPMGRITSARSGKYCDNDSTHQVCAKSLPADFAHVTGQGNWSEAVAGQPWCVCKWAYKGYTGKGHHLDVNCAATKAKGKAGCPASS